MSDEKKPAGDAAAAPKGGNTGKVLTLAIVLAIVAAEVGAAYLYLPSRSASAECAEEESHAEEHAEEAHGGHGGGHGSHGGHGGHGEKEAKKPSTAEEREIDFTQFTVNSYQAATATNMRVEFHLFAVVASGDADKVTTLFEENKNRIRDQVIVIARSASMTDLTDAGLGLIKRRILEKTNQSLGKPLVKDVIFSDFSVTER